MFHIYKESSKLPYTFDLSVLCGAAWDHDCVYIKQYPKHKEAYQYEDSDYCLDCVELYPIIILSE